MKKVGVILNPSTGQDHQELKQLFSKNQIEADIIVLKRELDLSETIRTLIDQGAEAIVAGGGDGTVSAVAGELAGTKTPLGILPLGTLNHFAKDLKLPLDLSDAIRAIANENTQEVDAAEVNDLVFINNSSVGVYPRLVRGREAREAHLGKWPALAVSLWQAIVHYHPIRLRYVLDGRDVTARVSMAFIGNNDYGLEDPGVSNRERIDRGVLSLYIVPARGRLALAWSALASLGRPQPRHLQRYYPTEVSIDLPGAQADIALDGEVVKLDTPLVYQIQPRALRILV